MKRSDMLFESGGCGGGCGGPGSGSDGGCGGGGGEVPAPVGGVQVDVAGLVLVTASCEVFCLFGGVVGAPFGAAELNGDSIDLANDSKTDE